jgi:autotransporter-associated beta strand protein
LEVTQQSALTSETWQGGLTGGANVWALSDGSTSSNWTTDGFSATPLTPGSAADVLFTAINSPTNQTAMVLGANMAIRSMTVDDSSAVTLNADGNSLTISNAAGITVNSGAGAVTLNSFLTLGAAQTWTNNSANPLTIGGDISNGSNGLTIAGSGDITISGQIRHGTGGLTMNGSGTLSLVGANVSFKGTTTVNSGTIKAESPHAFGIAISNINGVPYGWGYANVAFGSDSTGVIKLNGNHVVLSSLSTHATVGSPVVENASSTPVTLTVTEGTSTGTAASHTYAGVLQDGTGGGSLGLQVTKGTLTLKGANTYSGDTAVAGGTLILFDDAGLTFVVTNSSNNGISGIGTATLNGDFTIDTSAVTATSGFWMLVNTATLIETFGATFTVAGAGWSESGDVWTKVEGPKTWTFTEATGVLTLVSSGGPSAYDAWAAAKGLTGLPGSGTDPASGADPDKDGRSNLGEFAFNGNPLSGADNGRIYVLSEDSDFDDPDAQKELILTVAVRAGTPAFTGSPSPTASQDGISYTIEGSLTLGGFATAVHVVPTPVTINGITPLPAAGTGYEYRSFSLSGSNGLPGKGFIRAKVTQP